MTASHPHILWRGFEPSWVLSSTISGSVILTLASELRVEGATSPGAGSHQGQPRVFGADFAGLHDYSSVAA